MFDLLQHAGGTLPILCCRILPFEMPAISVEALRIACESLGAVFLDLPSLRQQLARRAERGLMRIKMAARGRDT